MMGKSRKTFTYLGSDEYTKKLKALGDDAEAIIGKAIYPAAGMLADAIRANIKALPKIRKIGDGMIEGVSEPQRRGLLDSFGITPMQRRDGIYDVQIGFGMKSGTGYNSIKTKRWPKGQPNLMIARSVESGTSFLKKTPFVRPAVNKYKKKIEEMLEKAVDDEIAKRME